MKYFEPIFHVFYLSSIFFMAIKMINNSKNNKLYKLFGYMAFILGFGDSFHLIPRIYALLTTGLEANAKILGIGKFITSITMTFFYIILLKIWEIRFNKNNNKIEAFAYILALFRIVLSVMPQNQWTLYDYPFNWGIYRNIPFTILGTLMIYIILNEAYKYDDKVFKNIGIAIIISFACYIPVVLFTNKYKLVGLLMIPKTLAYLYAVYVAYKEFKCFY